MMTCPRCGLPEVSDPVCPRCGVVFAKIRDRATRPARRSPAPPVEVEPVPASLAQGYTRMILPALLLCGALGGGIWATARHLSRPSPPAAPPSGGETAAVPYDAAAELADALSPQTATPF